jgi:hypothetical protein
MVARCTPSIRISSTSSTSTPAATGTSAWRALGHLGRAGAAHPAPAGGLPYLRGPRPECVFILELSAPLRGDPRGLECALERRATALRRPRVSRFHTRASPGRAGTVYRAPASTTTGSYSAQRRDMTSEPNPIWYIAARLSLWIWPTLRAMLYVERTDQWRIARRA